MGRMERMDDGTFCVLAYWFHFAKSQPRRLRHFKSGQLILGQICLCGVVMVYYLCLLILTIPY
jgi:hypothetical protein